MVERETPSRAAAFPVLMSRSSSGGSLARVSAGCTRAPARGWSTLLLEGPTSRQAGLLDPRAAFGRWPCHPLGASGSSCDVVRRPETRRIYPRYGVRPGQRGFAVRVARGYIRVLDDTLIEHGGDVSLLMGRDVGAGPRVARGRWWWCRVGRGCSAVEADDGAGEPRRVDGPPRPAGACGREDPSRRVPRRRRGQPPPRRRPAPRLALPAGGHLLRQCGGRPPAHRRPGV